MTETLKKVRSAIPFLILTAIIFTLWWVVSTVSQVTIDISIAGSLMHDTLRKGFASLLQHYVGLT